MEPEQRPWLDILGRKHECGPSLFPYVTLQLSVGGKPSTLRLPDRFEEPARLAIRAVIGVAPLIAVIATHPGDEEMPEPTTILMVASQADDGSFVVHVWHELFPWALKSLGMSDEGDGRP